MYKVSVTHKDVTREYDMERLMDAQMSINLIAARSKQSVAKVTEEDGTLRYYAVNGNVVEVPARK